MSLTFREQCVAASRERGNLSVFFLLLAALHDLVGTAWRERLGRVDPLRKRSRPPRRRSGATRFAAAPLLFDIKFACRLLAKTPAFTVLTVAVLGGGLGLSVFTYSFLSTVMFKPLPFEDGSEIVRIMSVRAGRSGWFDAADLVMMRPKIASLSEIGVWTDREVHLGGDGWNRTLYGAMTDWRAFSITRVRPLLGRGLQRSDTEAGAEPVAVLAYSLWQSQFGGDPSILGTRARVNEVPTRIVGVMPEGFGFPLATRVWMPLDEAAFNASVPGERFVSVFGRLKPGVSLDQASAEVNALMQAIRLEDGRADDAGVADGATIMSFQLAQMGDQGALVFAVLNVLALFILLLACINVTNLLLARTNERRRETAVRVALGAPRVRLILQSMWESVLICLLGGVLAIGVATLGLRVVDTWARTHLPDNILSWWVWDFDGYALAATAAFVGGAILLVGGAVAFRATHGNFNAVLRDSTAGAGGRGTGRLGRALVVMQVVLVSVLMFFGSVSGVAAYRMMNLDVFDEMENVLAAVISPDGDRYDTREKRALLYRAVYDDLDRAEGLEGVTLRNRLAFIEDDDSRFAVDGVSYPRDIDYPRAYINATLGSVAYMTVQVRAGRYLDERDTETSAPAAVVSESVARAHWPDVTPLGRRIRLPAVDGRGEWRTVVGVVSDVMEGNPITGDQSSMSVYVPLLQVDAPGASVIVRHDGNEQMAQAVVRRTLLDQDPLLVPDRIIRYREMLGQMTMLTTSTTKLFLWCFVFALVLAASGIYGLTARSVSQRAREVGVRRALGASNGRIVRLLMRQGGVQLGLGVALALPLTAGASIVFSQVLAMQTGVYVACGTGVAIAVTAIFLGATYLPSRRAVRLEPSHALWQE